MLILLMLAAMLMALLSGHYGLGYSWGIAGGAALLLGLALFGAFLNAINSGAWDKLEAKLVDGWGQAWRWFSVQAMALALALQGAWAALPDDLKAGAPGWAVSAVTATLLAAGILGRLVKQPGDAP